MNKDCPGTTANGEPCKSKPQNGSQFCFFHDPEKAEERKAASAAGGKAGPIRTLPPDTPWVSVRNLDDIIQVAEATINRVLRGEISHKVAYSVAILAGLQLKAIELQIDAERVGALEALQTGR